MRMPKQPPSSPETSHQDQSEARFRQALEALQKGQASRAESLLRALIDAHPEAPGPREVLGLALLRQNQAEAAVAAFEGAVALGLDSAGIQNNLALALSACGRNAEAVKAARRAAGLEPARAELQVNLGNRLKTAGLVDEAIVAYRRALELKPTLVSVRVSLGSAHAALGHKEAALNCYREALTKDPNNASAFYHLALARKAEMVSLEPALVQRFQERLSEGALSSGERILVEAALGTIAEGQEDYDRAFNHYRNFNAARREQRVAQGERYDRDAHSRFVDSLIAAFPERPVEREGEFASERPRPIFIVGLPRSGTTLVEQILARHESVSAGGELLDLPLLTDAIEDYPQSVAGLSPERLASLAGRYREALRRIESEAAYVTDKLPNNFLHLGFIARLFPDATVIHCRRDPLDTCLSCFTQNFTRDQAFADDLGDLGAYYQDYRRLMTHWQAAVPLALVEVHYETLIADPEEQVRHLLDAIQLPWDPACLQFQEAGNPVLTASQWQVRQALNDRSIGRWRRFEAYLGPLIEIIGEPESPG